jgi:hypothetical protein
MKRFTPHLLLIAALGLGLLADLVVRMKVARGNPIGINLFLWSAFLVLGFVALQRLTGASLIRGWQWMAAAGILLSITFLWRRADALNVFAVLGLGITLVLMSLRGARERLEECGVLEYVHGFFTSIIHTISGLPLLLFMDLRKEETGARRTGLQVGAVLRGAAFALPVILIVGALFMGADAVFEQAVISIFDVDLEELIAHVFFTGFVTWVVAGYLRGAFIARPVQFPYAETKPLSLGFTEVSVVLGSSIVLFAVFIAIQFRYLFGGADMVRVTESLTYAQYARRGFFELTAVVALILPLLLVLDWLLRKENASHVRLFRIMASAQVVLLFAVIASALQRMLLYQQEYGLTALRIYTVAFMAWMGALLVWYLLTALQGKRNRFAFGGVVAAVLTLLVLVAINPDGLIARTNIARGAEGKLMDAEYLRRLSDDAIPALLEGLDKLDAKSREGIVAHLQKRRTRLEEESWLSWSWSSSVARRMLNEHAADLIVPLRPHEGAVDRGGHR